MLQPITSTEFPNPALYVGDLAQDVTEAFLFDMFNRIGPVTSVRLCRDAATRKSLGYAYVNFQRPEDADNALENKNYERIRGRPCRIMRSQRDPTKRKSQAGNVFVKPLNEDVDAKILYDTFSVVGAIESVKVPYKDDSLGGALKARGYGFVQFTNPEHAQVAIDTIKTVGGFPVTIELFKPRQNRDTIRQTNVFIKNIPLSYTQEQFQGLFADCGDFNSAKLVAEGDNSKGFGYVNFVDPASAAACIEKLNGLKLQDAASATDDGAEAPALYATYHKAKAVLQRERQQLKQQGQSTKFPQGQNLYVKNLADDVDENTLKTEFSKFGNITSCMIRREPSTKVSMGFGFVCFESAEQAEKAIAEILSHTPFIFHGKPLYVALAQNKAQRQEFLRLQRLNFYTAQQHNFASGVAYGYSQPPYGMPPPRGDFGQSYYPPNPSVPPANLVRQPQRFPGGPGQFPDQQGAPPQGRPYGPGGYNQQMGGPQQGGQNRGPRGGPYPGGRGAPYPGRRDQGPQGQQGGAGRQQWQQPQGPPQMMMQQLPPQQQPQQPRPVAVQQQQPVAPQQQQAARPGGLNATEIARMPPDQAKRLIGENMYPKIGHLLDAPNKNRAGKITGMLLEALDSAELLNLLEDNKALDEKLAEALRVLNEAEAQ
jgi:polyadenylate-binding protein